MRFRHGTQVARRESYDPVAKALHWSMALAILGMIVLGIYVSRLSPSMRTFRLFDLHKSIGLTLMLLACLRLLWRVVRGAPETLRDGTKAWELVVAHLVHVLLYALMIGIPLFGWFGASASGLPMTFYGIADIPRVVPPNKERQQALLQLHDFLNWLLIGLLALHVAGALKRHFVLRDATLRRMLPFGDAQQQVGFKDEKTNSTLQEHRVPCRLSDRNDGQRPKLDDGKV